ncbi:hypothetical protein [Bifidobacterium vansinderenii]|uniref:Uncharacterized protein n=1 Tax=Bifidobacterium vansinderenii TaxID=1984871 RepID=A0A229VYV8_9BIFI|nr:hypothetical protein [Bifidobacterium vansinderenii]OXN00804.1 hypothetical protein Tam10B_0759 [Bifidobacterium vansinderenii]
MNRKKNGARSVAAPQTPNKNDSVHTQALNQDPVYTDTLDLVNHARPWRPLHVTMLDDGGMLITQGEGLTAGEIRLDPEQATAMWCAWLVHNADHRQMKADEG